MAAELLSEEIKRDADEHRHPENPDLRGKHLFDDEPSSGALRDRRLRESSCLEEQAVVALRLGNTNCWLHCLSLFVRSISG